MSKSIFLLAIVAFPSLLQAQNRIEPALSGCISSIQRDSVGRGMEAGLAGRDVRPLGAHEPCYAHGVAIGKSLHQGLPGICANEFWLGYPEGLKASNVAGGSYCFEMGYFSGNAALRSSAREGTGEASCVNAYKLGRSHGLNRREKTTIATEPQNTCYATGYWEGIED